MSLRTRLVLAFTAVVLSPIALLAFGLRQDMARRLSNEYELRVHYDWPRGGYAIINMSSCNAVVAIPNQVPYAASKGGVNQLTKVMGLSLADKGIRVNAIGPGTIATDLARNAVLGSEESRRKIMARTPLGRLGEADEVASVAVFLASDESSYMTGQTIYPDGGRLALNYTVPVK